MPSIPTLISVCVIDIHQPLIEDAVDTVHKQVVDSLGTHINLAHPVRYWA